MPSPGKKQANTQPKVTLVHLDMGDRTVIVAIRSDGEVLVGTDKGQPPPFRVER